MKNGSPFSSSSLIPIFFLLLSLPSNASHDDQWLEGAEPAVKRANERKSLLKTEFGEISAVNFNDGSRFGPYHLQFITLEPNSLFLPVLLHSDMVFYTHTGSGRLNWLEDEKLRTVDLRRGVVFRLQPGSIFYLQSSLETEREKLRIYALFSSTDEERYDPAIGAYSSITDLVRGFDKKILQESFKAPEEVIEEIMNATKPPLIVHAAATQSKKPTSMAWELEARFLKAFMGDAGGMRIDNKKSKQHVYNIYEHRPDFENCNGRSLTVTRKKFHQLKGSNVGLFYVDLASGSMMGPHWNRLAWELGIGVSDEPGMVRVGCSRIGGKSSKCKNWRFMVSKGDAFVAPKFHPMVQMAFNNASFAFIGFSTTYKRTDAQFMAGGSSVLQKLDRKVLASSFDVNETTINRLLSAQVESVILECKSCAEEEQRIMEEEEEEARKREEEEARKREEEERKKREEEARKWEEEEARKREEEEARKREEEERKKREEEEARKREEEEARKREEEEARKREEEEARKREEEEARKREEEEARKREEEEAKKREDERKRREEEEAEEEAAGREERKREEEEARKREEEEEASREEEKKREEEEEWREGKRITQGRREGDKNEEEMRNKEDWDWEEAAAEDEEEEGVIRILEHWT